MPDACPGAASIRTKGLPQHFDISLARADHPQKRADGRRFARAIQTQKTVDLPGLDSQVQTIDGNNIAKALGQLFYFNGECGHAPSLPQRLL